MWRTGLAGIAAQSRQRRTLAGGQMLYGIGDAADAVFIVHGGALAVRRPGVNGLRTVAIARQGECIGEFAVLAEVPRTSSVVALRDATLEAIDADAFRAAMRATPELAVAIARLIARRASRVTPDHSLEPHVIGIAALTPAADVRLLAERLAQQLRMAKRAVSLFDGPLAALPAAIAAAETHQTLLLIPCAADDRARFQACSRQADRLLLMGRATLAPPLRPVPELAPMQTGQLVDLVLEHESGGRPQRTAAWLAASGAMRVHHVAHDGQGVARLARLLTGTSVGLALSGGGARAFAHVGAVKALREAGIAIDLVAGTSMGAIIAAGVALGWDDAELDGRMREAFVRSSPMDDIAPPIIAMTRGRKVDARLGQHFGGHSIEDLPIDFACQSTNLTSGMTQTHVSGNLAQALRASIALPGLLPPVVSDGQVLVDGGVLINLPTRWLRERHEGEVIASDVSRAAGLGPAAILPPPSWLRWFTSGAWRRGPPMVSILMRAATVAAGAELAAARDAADLYVMPDVSSIEIRDWRLYPQAVAAGYAAMREALAHRP